MINTEKKDSHLLGTEQKNHLYSFDILRILAAFFVVLNHTIGYYYDQMDVHSFEWVLTAICFFICKTAVPIFLMMTGCLQLNNFTYKKSVKYTKRILIVLVFWSLVHYVVINIGDPNAFSLNKVGNSIYKAFTIEPIAVHFWYLYTILGIYLMLPFLSTMSRGFNNYDYHVFVLLWLVFFSIIPFTNRVWPNSIVFVSNFQVPLFSGWFGFLFLGYSIKNEDCKKVADWLLPIIFVVCIGISLFVIIYKNDPRIIDNSRYIPTVLLASSIFASICKAENNIKEYLRKHNILQRIVINVSNATFGIYLMHFTMIYVFRNYILSATSCSFLRDTLGGVLVFDCLIFLLSYVITSLLQKLPIIRCIVM